jgi:hypothetical protein
LDPTRFFKNPAAAGQRQYEALRAHYLDHLSGVATARRFGYTASSFNSLKQRFKTGKIRFFVTEPRGPKGPRVSKETRARILEYRKKCLSAYQIAEVLETVFHETISVRTVARILEAEGFPKLPRRTQLKIGLTKNNTLTPEYAAELDFTAIDGREIDCAVGGIFLFLPILERFKFLDTIDKAKLPKSPGIPAASYVMSMLALKLIGKERLCHINDFNLDAGFGLFSLLNFMPKATAISTYSYRLQSGHIRRFMKLFVETQNKGNTYGKGTINLDTHTVQHYGDESILEAHWSGARGRVVKGALTFIAQDCDSRCQIYVNTDIMRSESDDEVIEFVKFWRKIRGCKFKETLVFDSKLTTYENLRRLDDDGVKFITLRRRRGVQLVKNALDMPKEQWKRIRLDSPVRKFASPLVHDSMVELVDYGKIRQIVMTENGHDKPAFFLTNLKQPVKEVIERYAKRWNIENNIDEVVKFFHLNALSSPILIKVHFDTLMTMVADTLYHHLAQSLRGFEACEAATLFRHFIDMPAKISVTTDTIVVRFPLRAHNPVLSSANLDRGCPPIPWLGDRRVKFVWNAKF